MLFLVRFFGPGVTDLLRVMWSADTGGDGGAGGGAAEAGAGAGPAEDVTAQLSEAVTELVNHCKALPNVIPEMITGSTVAEVKAALSASQAAYSALAAKLGPAGAGVTPAAATPVPVAAGGVARTVAGPSDGKITAESAMAKILAGMGQKQSR